MNGALELSWIAPKSLSRLRRKPEWRALLEAPAARRSVGAIAPALANQKLSVEDRRDVTEILVRTRASDGPAVRAAVAAGVQADGRYSPALLVVEGELRVELAELDRLKALAANALGFAAGDEPLQAAVDAAVAYTKLPDLLPTPLAVEAHARRIRDAFARVPRGVPADHLDVEARASLLEQRRYKTQPFRGVPHLRFLVDVSGDPAPLLAFVPMEATSSLPLAVQFPARLVVEVHPFADAYDRQTYALAILAIARCLPARAEAAAG